MNRILYTIESFFIRQLGAWYRVLRISWLGFSLGSAVFMAAAIAFYAVVCIGPLGILGGAALRLVLGPGGDTYRQLTEAISRLGGGAADQILGQANYMIRNPESHYDPLTNLASAAALIWAGLSLFQMIERSLTAASMGAQRRNFFTRTLVSMVMMAASGLLLAGYMLVTAGLASLQVWLSSLPGIDPDLIRSLGPVVISPSLRIGLSFLAFLLLYKFLPARRVPWRSGTIGALVATVLWAALSPIFVAIISHSQRHGSIYGGLTGVVVFALWCFLGSRVLLFGAYFAAAYEHVFIRHKASTEDDTLINFHRRAAGRIAGDAPI